MKREYPERPIVGVAGVVFDGDQVVVVRRGRPPAYGEWSLPGGAVELGESLEQAVVREVYEEIGLKIEIVDVAAVLERVFWDEEEQVRFHYVLVDFLCLKTGGRLRASSDALSCAKVPMASLSSYRLSVQTEEVIKRAYLRLNGESTTVYRVNPPQMRNS
jgi:ADP-ribose pyrophosphatase YjhB (NUDIX family)